MRTTALTALFGCLGSLEDRKNNHYSENLNRVRKYVDELENRLAKAGLEAPDFSACLPERPTIFTPSLSTLLDNAGIEIQEIEFSFNGCLWELSNDDQVEFIADYLRSFDDFVDENNSALIRFENERKLADLEILSIRWDSGNYQYLQDERDDEQRLEIAADMQMEMRKDALLK